MQTDILIIGGGVVALALAKELVAQGHEDVVILEKEAVLAMHASGRNSGVMHAGIYYPPGTLRAKFCLEGNFLMQAYCETKGLPLHKTGKVIVAKEEAELPTLNELYHRATQNGAKVELIDEQQLLEIEPHAKTLGQALYSHYTAVVDPKRIMQALYDELLASGKVKFLFNTKMMGLKAKQQALTNQGIIHHKLLINAAGSFADQIAHMYGIAKDMHLLPFKGIYRKLRPEYKHLVNGNIYPVPNINNPFLGVHFTKNIHGDVYLGPTAIPALGRENYGILSGMDRELFSILFKESQLFFKNPKFRAVALTEPKKYLASYFFNDAKKLVKELKPDWLLPTNKVGIRPQLINWKTKELVMDFMVETGEDSVHILNAISPAFTSSMAFAKFVVNEYIKG